MKERVTTRLGTSNVLLVCPHAHNLDDTHTDIITMEAADILDAFAVINNGWKRSKVVNELQGEANCNDFNHCQSPVVKAEFLTPVFSALNDIEELADYNNYSFPDASELPITFMIHGIGNGVRNKANDPKLDLIVGFGAGQPNRHTCEEWRRNLFIDSCQKHWRTYAGAPGGAYSAHSKNNLTQAVYRSHNHPVLQLEFIFDLRKDAAAAKQTGKQLAELIESFLIVLDYQRPGNVAPPPEI